MAAFCYQHSFTKTCFQGGPLSVMDLLQCLPIFFCLVSFEALWNKTKPASVFCQSSASDEDPSLIVAPMETRHWNTSGNRRRLSTWRILTTAGIHLENISHCLHVFSEVAAHFPAVEAVAVYTSVGAAVLMDGGGGRKVSTQPVWPFKLKGWTLLISTDGESVCCDALPQQTVSFFFSHILPL